MANRGSPRKYESYDGPLGKVESAQAVDGIVVYLVRCSECNLLHERSAKHLKKGIKSRKCEHQKPHNYVGYSAQEKRDRIIRKQYGITLAQYNEMLLKQGGKCAICKNGDEVEGRRLAIDHDHDSGDVRGLLCGSCNRALGLFKDNKRLLAAAIKYLTVR